VFIEPASVTDNPQQFAVILAAYPVAGDCRILASVLPQQAAQSVEALLGDGGLPGTLAPTFGKLVQDTACLGQRIFRALRDEQYVHGLPDSVVRAICFNVSMIRSSASARVNT
jgi:hypothetical protein